MLRVVIILAVGIAIGYFVGFRDARVNQKNIVERVIDRVGGDARGGVSNDVDRQFEKLAR